MSKIDQLLELSTVIQEVSFEAKKVPVLKQENEKLAQACAEARDTIEQLNRDLNMCRSENVQLQSSLTRTINAYTELDAAVSDRIERVVAQDNTVVVFWESGRKTKASCVEGDKFDYEKGLLLAILKAFYGNDIYNQVEEITKKFPHTKSKKTATKKAATAKKTTTTKRVAEKKTTVAKKNAAKTEPTKVKKTTTKTTSTAKKAASKK